MNNIVNFAERILAVDEARRGRISDGYVPRSNEVHGQKPPAKLIRLFIDRP